MSLRSALSRAGLLHRHSVPKSFPSRAFYHVVFFGSDDVSLPTLRMLHESARGGGAAGGVVTSLRVVCPSDRRASRSRGAAAVALPVKRFCLEESIPVSEVPEGVRDLAPLAEALVPPLSGGGAGAGTGDACLGVVVSFGYFMPPSLLARLRLGAINMHPSLLPRFRGAAPIPAAILAGDTHTGVSVIEIHPTRFDAGAILAQEAFPIAPDEGCAHLTARLAEAGARAVLETLANLPARRTTARQQQNGGGGARDDVGAARRGARGESSGGGGGAGAEIAGGSGTAGPLLELQQERLLPRAPKLRPEQGLLRWSGSGARIGSVDTSRAADAAAGSAGGGWASPLSDGAAPDPAPPFLTVERVLRMARAFDDSFRLYSFFEPRAVSGGGASRRDPASAMHSRADAALTRAPASLPALGSAAPLRLQLLRLRRCTALELDALARSSEGGRSGCGAGGSGAWAGAPGALAFIRLATSSAPAAATTPAAAPAASPPLPYPTLPAASPLLPRGGGGALCLRLADGWVAIERLCLATRREASGADFAAGYRIGFCTHRLVDPPAAVSE